MKRKTYQRKKLRNARTHIRVRALGTRPRITVFRSNRFISVQLIDDAAGKTIASVGTRGMKEKQKPVELAKLAGMELAKKAKSAGISEAIFDRGRYAYHGIVKAVAEGIREGGMTI